MSATLRRTDLPPQPTLHVTRLEPTPALRDELREVIDHLHVVHNVKKALDKVGYDYPETGEDDVFINVSQNPSVIGWTPEKSPQRIDRRLLEFNKPEHQARVKWRENSVAFRDNRSTLHYPVYNYGDDPRRMKRVLIAYDDIPHRVKRANAA
jgi:taurine dioxygenase